MQLNTFVAVLIFMQWVPQIAGVTVTDYNVQRAKNSKWVYYTIGGQEKGVRVHTGFSGLKELEERCQKDGAHVASIHSKEESDFIYELVEKAFLNGARNVDGTFIHTGYTFTLTKIWWKDNTPVDFEKFSSDEPICGQYEFEMCGLINMGRTSTGKQNYWCLGSCEYLDSTGEHKNYGVCGAH